MPSGQYVRTPEHRALQTRIRQSRAVKSREDVVCRNCGCGFSSPLSNRAKFCSSQCWFTYRRQHCPTGVYVSQGYRFNSQTKRGEHREIAERALGRRLGTDEVVHHINGNSLDNRNENLLVCTRSYHQWLHQEMSLRYAREHF